jgi:hypothetical protein
MAQPHETGNPIVTATNPISDLLASPLGPDWTVERLAEQVLDAIAARRAEDRDEFVLDAATITDRQSRRLLRPLLACLAAKSAAEAGTPATLYGGHFSFKRPGPEGPVWILGQFENRPGSARVTLRRSSSSPHWAGEDGEEPRVTAKETVCKEADLADLLARARRGEREPLESLHKRLEEKLRRAAHRRLGNVLRPYVDSMDIVQSAQKSLLVCLREGKYDIPDEEKLTALAMRILQRKVARKWRKARQDLKLRNGIAREEKACTEASGGEAHAVENEELVHHLKKYMNQTEKELVDLLLQGHTITSAAELRGLKPAYARVLIGRMRTRLAGMFELPPDFP